MLRAVFNRCEALLGYLPDPEVVVTDFEVASINAVNEVVGDHVRIQGCFYHLTQSTWRKIQDLELVNLYKDNESIQHFVGMLDRLAFLPESDVDSGMIFLRQN